MIHGIREVMEIGIRIKIIETQEIQRDPPTNASGPFTEGQRPIQCFKCKGWGHLRRICPSKGNLNFLRGESKSDRRSSPKSGTDTILQQQSRTKSVIWKAVHPVQQYHNPDPLIRLIGPLNECFNRGTKIYNFDR